MTLKRTNPKLNCCDVPMIRKQARIGLYYWKCPKCEKWLPDTSQDSPNRKKHKTKN